MVDWGQRRTIAETDQQIFEFLVAAREVQSNIFESAATELKEVPDRSRNVI